MRQGMTLFFALGLAGSVQAQLTVSGADIVNGSCGTFYNGTPSVVDTSFQINDSFASSSVVYEVVLVPPGELSTGDDVTLNLLISMTRIADDNDSTWGVADGNLSTRVGYFAFDGATHATAYGGMGTGAGEFNTTENLQIQGSCAGSCGSSIGSEYSVDLTFEQSGGGGARLTQTTTEGVSTATTFFDFPTNFDVADGLTLIMAKQSPDEQYQVNSITFDPAVDCEGTVPPVEVPVPTLSLSGMIGGIALFALMAGWVFVRRFA